MNAFPSLTFIDPVEMVPVPFSNRLMVVEKSGRLVVFENRATANTRTVLLDIRSQVESSHDSGMMGLAFHPEFGVAGSPNRNFLYVFYRFTVQKSDTNRAYCRLSRFTWDAATNAIAPSSEFVLINQYDRHNWHNGGGIFFGDDGFLYLSLGDEGGANDQFNSGQRMDLGLFAGVLRIDVDRDPTRSHPIRRQPRNPATPPSGWPNSYSQGYFIPNDNPWQSPNGSQLEEFYAIGLRSPHRMTRDPVSGEIWLGDVGQGTREEVSRVPRGGNLQWPYREGAIAGPKAKPSSLIGFDVPPVHDYGRSAGTCVIGGYVYRGSLHPELQGKYLFGDHGSGRIWSLDASGASPVVTQLLTLTSHGPGPKNGMGAFGLDASGEIYVLSLAGTDLDGGRIYRLEKTSGGVPEPPQLLSQTTAFTDLASLAPRSGLMPYGVNQPLWSDGSEKRRWIAIPNDGTPNTAAERIAWSEQGHWAFPVGTVLVKHFELPGRRLETRFLVRGDEGEWYGFTYRWREDGSDAELLPGEPVVATVTTAEGPRSWHFPGRGECFACHTSASGRVLGLRTSQLNGDFFYESTGRSANQLVTLNRLGFLSPALDETRLATLPRARREDDASASLERRARSYLDVNCAHCHQPAAPTQAAFDARLSTPPWFQNLVNAPASNPLGIANAKIVAPGDPAASVLPLRVASTAEGIAMPPIAKHRIDAAGLALLNAWIASLDPAIGPSGPVSGATPSDHLAPVLTLAGPPAGGTVTGPFAVTLSASEPILGLTTGDFSLVNATVSGLSGAGTSWTFTVTPLAPGPGSVALASDRVTDAVGNANEAVAPLPFVYAAPPAPTNLLSNGGFENGLGGWDNGGGVAASASGRTGSGAASMGGSTWIVQTVPVEVLENYLYSVWIRTTAAGSRAEAGLSFWDENGAWVRDRVLELSPGTSWQRFEIAFTAPVGARSVSAWILTGPGAQILLDDFDLSPGGAGEPRPALLPGHTNLLPNGNFEAATLVPWDTGGTNAARVAAAHGGSGAVRLGSGAYVVQTLPTVPETEIALVGFARMADGGGRLEVGFSFWGAGGGWITDRTLVLPETAGYEAFLVDTLVPEGASTMTVWAWRETGVEAFVDELVLFRPDENLSPGPGPGPNPGTGPNLLSNGGFESGGLSPWDTGGSDVRLVSAARSGSFAARLGAESFIVENQSTSSGEELDFGGFHRSPSGGAGLREAGFTYWGASGQWLGDEIAVLGAPGDWSEFSLRGTTPPGAVAVSVWAWSGLGASLDLDDLRLVRVGSGEGSAEAAGAAPEEPLVMMALKSSRSLDLVGLVSDPALGAVLAFDAPVYANGWSAAPAAASSMPSARARRIARAFASEDPKSLAVGVSGTGVFAARWRLDAPGGSATLRLLVDGLERGRWFGGGASGGWRTIAVPVFGSGLHTVEFRLEPGLLGVRNPVAAELADIRFLLGTPETQPDLAIGAPGGRLAGFRIVNFTGARQTFSARRRARAPVRFRVLWRNAAPQTEDSARFSGPGGDRFHRVSYFSTDGARRNLTSGVVLGSQETELTGPGGREALLVEVRASRPGLRRGYRGLLRASSPLRIARRDAVGFRVLR